MILDLNKAFPASSTGTHGPLPKQAEFMSAAMNQDPKAPRYIRYCGGVS